MQALVFENDMARVVATKLLASLSPRAYVGPLAPIQLREIPEPQLPADDWVCLEAVTWAQPHGIGLAESRLWDRRGPLGRSLQSLLLERRDGACGRGNGRSKRSSGGSAVRPFA